MKVTLDGTYAGSGGKQSIKIVGELTGEGLGGGSSVDFSGVEGKIKALEEVVLELQAQVQALQAQNLHVSVKELAAALEVLKAEQTVAPATVSDVAAPATETTTASVTSKKKST